MVTCNESHLFRLKVCTCTMKIYSSDCFWKITLNARMMFNDQHVARNKHATWHWRGFKAAWWLPFWQNLTFLENVFHLTLVFTLASLLSSLLFLPAFITMIVLSSLRIARGTTSAATRPPPATGLAGLPSLFGVCVYSFMCHHSLPSLVTPVSRKRHLVLLSFIIFTLVLTFYALLCFTATFAFTPATLYDLYSLNFLADCSLPPTIRYLLGLFPVFTISTNFPIIAVTLRNNLRVIFLVSLFVLTRVHPSSFENKMWFNLITPYVVQFEHHFLFILSKFDNIQGWC